mgnify:CR=1 FL=1
MVLFYLVFAMQIVLAFFDVTEDSILTTENLIGLSGGAIIMILLNVVSAFSKNDYYLSFHGTLMLVSSLMQVSAL